MIRQLISKWGIMSIDMQNAYEKDSKSASDVDMVSEDEVDLSADQNNKDEVVEIETVDQEKKEEDVEAGFFGEEINK